jgi:hypothetical protein
MRMMDSEGEALMPDLSTFISEDFGSVATAAVSLLAIPGVIIAGYIQGKNARRAGETQAAASLKAAERQALLSYSAALDSAKEMSRENHAQWQRDRCQEIWADYVKELDVLLSQLPHAEERVGTDGLLKAYARVELMSPRTVLSKAEDAKREALLFRASLLRIRRRWNGVERLGRAKGQLRMMVREAAQIEEHNGELFEYHFNADGTHDLVRPSSPEEIEETWERFERGRAADAALAALTAAASSADDAEAGEQARVALINSGFSEGEAAGLAGIAQVDLDAHQAEFMEDLERVAAARDAFVAEAREELNALGA